jgi:hypothetical protein
MSSKFEETRISHETDNILSGTPCRMELTFFESSPRRAISFNNTLRVALRITLHRAIKTYPRVI